MKRKSRLPMLMILILCGVFFFSLWQVFSILRTAQKERRDFENLAQMVETAMSGGGQSERGQSERQDSPYAVLKEKNPHFFGWIYVEDTLLNYPVMYTPEQPEYYLHRNFEGEDSKSGVPFLAESCYDGCGNYLIYGHNMKNGTMFAPLLSYADSKYRESHPVIRFDTLKASYEYEVMSAFYSKIYAQGEEDAFRYYEYTDISTPDVFEEYMTQVRENALYDTGVEVDFGDEILTLSTCSYHIENGRFVVVARKKG